jgi:hypothetical protein
MNRRFNDLLETQTGLLLLLFICMLIFTALTAAIIFCAPSNEKAFLLFSNLLTGFASSLLTAAQVKRGAGQDKPNQDEPAGEGK